MDTYDRAEPPDLVRRFEKVRHHDRHHAGRRCGADPGVGVFQGQAGARFHSKPLGRLQERVWRRLARGVVPLGSNGMKPVNAPQPSYF